MKELTKAEEQVMQILWEKKNCFVKEIIAELPEPKPAYNTISTIVRILQSKGFVDHESFGKSHRYFPIVGKDDYRKFSMNNMMQGYFSGSASKLMSFFLKEKDLNTTDLDDLLKIIEDAKKDQK